MSRKNRTLGKNARRNRNLFKEIIAEFMENGLEAELDEELGYSR